MRLAPIGSAGEAVQHGLFARCIHLEHYAIASAACARRPVQIAGRVAEVPAIRGGYALMPTREAALAELGRVFEMIAAEHVEKGLSLPADSTAIVNPRLGNELSPIPSPPRPSRIQTTAPRSNRNGLTAPSSTPAPESLAGTSAAPIPPACAAPR